MSVVVYHSVVHYRSTQREVVVDVGTGGGGAVLFVHSGVYLLLTRRRISTSRPIFFFFQSKNLFRGNTAILVSEELMSVSSDRLNTGAYKLKLLRACAVENKLPQCQSTEV